MSRTMTAAERFDTEIEKGVPWADPDAALELVRAREADNWLWVCEILDQDGHVNAACSNYSKANRQWELSALASEAHDEKQGIEVVEPEFRIDVVENVKPKGYAFVIDGHVERFETSRYGAESFARGVAWAGREFGWASDRLQEYGKQAQATVVR
jgi:hypothetical protein